MDAMSARNPNPPMSADDFRELLIAAGMEQDEAAEKLGYHRVTVNRWVNGRALIKPAVAALIRLTIKPRSK